MYLQQNIGFIRKHKKLTYAQLGDAIGATEGMAKQYELKGATPPIPILCNIADFAGLSLDALIRAELTEENYTVLNHPQPSPGAVKKLQEQIDELSRRMTTVEKRNRVRIAR
ncbi:MAG TPA: helix-turn-helix transcriptional regulator [Flavisolibacter sp.]|jgi:transcriptional regulator with XRE-family HTH domain